MQSKEILGSIGVSQSTVRREWVRNTGDRRYRYTLYKKRLTLRNRWNAEQGVTASTLYEVCHLHQLYTADKIFYPPLFEQF